MDEQQEHVSWGSPSSQEFTDARFLLHTTMNEINLNPGRGAKTGRGFPYIIWLVSSIQLRRYVVNSEEG